MKASHTDMPSKKGLTKPLGTPSAEAGQQSPGTPRSGSAISSPLRLVIGKEPLCGHGLSLGNGLKSTVAGALLWVCQVHSQVLHANRTVSTLHVNLDPELWINLTAYFIFFFEYYTGSYN